MSHYTKIGTNSIAKNIPSTQEFICPMCLPNPKGLDSNEKRLHWAFIVRGSQVWGVALMVSSIHCKFLNARFECNDIVIFIYRHYPLDQNAKVIDAKGKTFNIKCFCILIQGVMPVYKNYKVIASEIYRYFFFENY